MKKLEMIIISLVIVAVTMVLRLVAGTVYASQTVGTPLYTDPGVDARIRSAPLPEGYSFGRALPPSIDLEVEWQPIGDPDFNRNIRGIFIDPDGIRVVDIHPQIMAGMRVWLSRDGGRTWQVEKWSRGVYRIVHCWRRRRETFEGRFVGVKELGLCRERAKVVLNPHSMGSALFRIWPLEAENLIKTEFRGLYEQRAHMSSATSVFLAQCPNNPEKLAFVTKKAGPPHSHIRVFVSLDGGQKWLEINSPPAAIDRRRVYIPPRIYHPSIAIKSIGDSIVLYIGQMGDGRKMLKRAVIKPAELEELLVKK